MDVFKASLETALRSAGSYEVLLSNIRNAEWLSTEPEVQYSLIVQSLVGQTIVRQFLP